MTLEQAQNKTTKLISKTPQKMFKAMRAKGITNTTKSKRQILFT
jgi:hypothetical protein